MKLVMTLLVRDEIDIIDHNLSHHLAGGVDHVVAIDNGSIDGTRDILAEYEQQGVVTIIDEPTQDFSQSIWMTNAALIARDKIGADWILNNDADEFWVSRTGDLKHTIRSSTADIITCPRLNLIFPWDKSNNETWANKCTYRVQNPLKVPKLANSLVDKLSCPYFYLDLPDKVLVRANNLTQVAQGNHAARFSKDVQTEQGTIDIFHYPVRSSSQFRSKIINGGESYARNKVLPQGTGWHWRRWYRMLQEQGIEAVLSDALPNDEDLTRDQKNGTVVKDCRMKNLLELLVV